MTDATDEVQLPPLFTAADRCDRCGAQARCRALLTSGVLLLCRHHGHEHKDALLAANALWEEQYE